MNHSFFAGDWVIAVVRVASMRVAFDYLPIAGWHTFSKNAALTEALWRHLDLLNWHYLNFTSDSSIWESKEDGSVLYVAYFQSAIVELYAEKGQAEQTFDPIALEFGLYKSGPRMPTQQ